MRRAEDAAYRGLLREALDPSYYADGTVPDTFDGRAGMVTVLCALACVRLSRIADASARTLVDRLNRRVLDGFDAAYRETGVGDHSIARKVRSLAEHHTGLGRALFAAIASGSEAEIGEILVRNGIVRPGQGAELAGRVLAMAVRLANQNDADVLEGRFAWR